ncbi:MAG TPA: dihydrofolate reductase family protein, partial [Vicinamibacterales bacterium]|nr:dihydrofolate reductase family protein [Vicinamibacterales bacterium]
MKSTAFHEFAARKEREAVSAAIAPLTTETDRPPADATAIGSAWTRTLFDGSFYLSPPRSADAPSTSLVFVQSRDGNTGARNPAALGGGNADAHLVYEGLSRVAADAVLAGAETIRGGHVVFSTWHPELVRLRASLGLPRHPTQIVATLRGLNFESLIFNVPEIPVLLLTVATCIDLMLTQLADRPWITPIVMPTPLDLPHALREIRRRGIARISCVGGRSIGGQLLDAGLVRDVYLTTTAKEGGEPNTPLYRNPIG